MWGDNMRTIYRLEILNHIKNYTERLEILNAVKNKETVVLYGKCHLFDDTELYKDLLIDELIKMYTYVFSLCVNNTRYYYASNKPDLYNMMILPSYWPEDKAKRLRVFVENLIICRSCTYFVSDYRLPYQNSYITTTFYQDFQQWLESIGNIVLYDI